MNSATENSFSTIVKDLSVQGLGVTHHPDGRVFFVPGVCPGDEIIVEIQSYKKNYGFAKLVEILKPSDSRVKPECSHHGFDSGQCGGCPWMFMEKSAQLKFKQNFVEHQLKRAQVTDDQTIIFPIWGSEKILGYRNRAQFKTDGKILGYVETGSNKIVDIKECPVLSEKNQKTLRGLRKKLPEKKWQQQNQKHLWNTIDIDDAFDESAMNQSVSTLAEEFFRMNQRLPFRQGNDAQNEKMREWLKNKIADNKNKGTVIELFCGSGNFTEVLNNSNFDKIIAVEVVGESLDILKNKNWDKVQIIEANLFQSKNFAKIQEIGITAKCLVLDPPRDGFPDIDLFIKPFKNIKDIYFISCEITAFARDAKKLKALGYTLKNVQPLDQFPQTPHVEVLTHFSK